MKRNKVTSEYKMAIVCDPLYKYGGAERHLKYAVETFPNCVLYTAYYDKDFVKQHFPNISVKTSFVQYLPWKEKLRYLYLMLLPLAYRGFKFKGFDGILSLSISFAKFAKGSIPHINICMSPPKFLWEKGGRTIKEGEQLKGLNKTFFKIYSFFMDTFFEDMWKKWDMKAAQRVDRMIAISKTVQKRVRKYYQRDSDVIYPPVEVRDIVEKTKDISKENWFLYLGRVESYKGVELAIRSAWDAKVPLKVAGTGDDLENMKALVKKLNAKGYVKFLGFVSDSDRLKLLAKSKALIFPVRKEDFGIVPVEANAAGSPVIAFREGGVTETISESNPKTGIFFEKYDVKSLSKALSNFDGRSFKADCCRKHAENFDTEIFKYKLKTYVADVLQNT